MNNTNTALQAPTMDDFEALLNESFGISNNIEGTVVKGRIIGIEREFAIIDFGVKTEGRVDLKEFNVNGQKADLKAGDIVDGPCRRSKSGGADREGLAHDRRVVADSGHGD